MIKVVSVEQMREIERATDAAGVSYDQMMQHAGRAVADVAILLLSEHLAERRVAVLIGPGNNGGDGLVAARLLKEGGAEVGCYLLKRRVDADPVFAAARDAGVFIAVAEDDQRWRVLKNLVGNADLVIDALLGTVARLPIEGDLHKLLTQAGAALHRDAARDVPIWPGVPVSTSSTDPIVLAVDVPSGLDCDIGEIDPVALPADVTVTFAAAKLGQLAFPGAEAVGELVVAGIGTPDNLPELTGIEVELATGPAVGALLPNRPSNAHKGTFGRVMIVAGSVPYTGAAALAASAAYRSGAGLVTLAVPQMIYPIVAPQIPEATWVLLPHEMGMINTAALEVFLEEAGEFDTLLLGPGLGREEETAGFLRGLLQGERQARRGSIGFIARSNEAAAAQGGRKLPAPMVIDADGLNLLAGIDRWWESVPAGTVVTPHPGEMARLTELERDDILADRLTVARDHAAKWNVVVVLKGAFTVVAGPDGRAVMMPFATDALATAGTGDVLAGCIVGFMAQGLTAFDAAVSGAYVHGLAGDLAGQETTSRSVVAGDVLRALPAALALIEPTS